MQVKAVKTKCDANQGQAGEIFIRYGFGLDDILSLIEAGVVRKIVGNHGSMYDFEGENFKGKDSLRKMLLDHPQKAELLKTRLCESLLENAPQAADITDEDEVLSDMRANIGDDDVVEGAGMEVEEATEEVTVGES